jgi:hypothetical protein
MFDLHNNYWQLADGRIWSSAKAAFVPADDVDYIAWLSQDNTPSRAPDENQLCRIHGWSRLKKTTGS